MTIGTDKRIFERIDGELAVRYSPKGSDGEFCSTTKNISGGGLRMSLLKWLSPGTILDIEIFKYNSSIKTICQGKIVWTWNEPMDKKNKQHFEAGVQFMNTDFLSVGRLINHLEAQKALL